MNKESKNCRLRQLHTFLTPLISNTVRAEIFAVVLFSRISRVKPSRKFPLQFMSIYSNDNISKIAKLTTRELPHLAKTVKITVRENNGVYSSRVHRPTIIFFFSGATFHIPLTKSATLNRLLHYSLWQFSGALF